MISDIYNKHKSKLEEKTVNHTQLLQPKFPDKKCC